jgi:hypothetical protein
MIPTAATPPTTPPAIGPAWFDGGLGLVELVGGLVELVGVLVELVGALVELIVTGMLPISTDGWGTHKPEEDCGSCRLTTVASICAPTYRQLDIRWN